MLKQTRNALIYSDLALFVMDTREGITFNDVALHNWLTLHQMRLKDDHLKMKAKEKKKEERMREGPTMGDFEEAVVVPEGVDALELEGKTFRREHEKIGRKRGRELDPLEK